MNATKFLHTQLLRPPLTPSFHTSILLQPQRLRSSRKLSPIKSSTDDSESAPPDAVEIRFRRGTRRRQKEQENMSNDEPKKIKVQKKWEDMSVSEKAVELYVGEKGALYWLNKFAYASIYIIIGAWILFRFVGPALNLYQLDSAPLAPEAMFKG
ncbi:uncharacterized protein LOC141643361 [Silene latifolia]|uniref:uncharacterized protein LOC141643361 n=1 Tax=Silene latifolia TaxID=37657 RepID=UPI003D782A35